MLTTPPRQGEVLAPAPRGSCTRRPAVTVTEDPSATLLKAFRRSLALGPGRVKATRPTDAAQHAGTGRVDLVECVALTTPDLGAAGIARRDGRRARRGSRPSRLPEVPSVKRLPHFLPAGEGTPADDAAASTREPNESNCVRVHP